MRYVAAYEGFNNLFGLKSGNKNCHLEGSNIILSINKKPSAVAIIARCNSIIRMMPRIEVGIFRLKVKYVSSAQHELGAFQKGEYIIIENTILTPLQERTRSILEYKMM